MFSIPSSSGCLSRPHSRPRSSNLKASIYVANTDRRTSSWQKFACLSHSNELSPLWTNFLVLKDHFLVEFLHKGSRGASLHVFSDNQTEYFFPFSMITFVLCEGHQHQLCNLSEVDEFVLFVQISPARKLVPRAMKM